MMAKESGRWAPLWNEIHSRRYGLSEEQAQGFETAPGPR